VVNQDKSKMKNYSQYTKETNKGNVATKKVGPLSAVEFLNVSKS